MMSTGNGSSMNPKPVPAWLNSAAWTSKPRSPIKPSYSFGERSNSATLMEPVGKSTGDQEDLLSSIAKVEKEVAATQEESDATGSATQPTQNADYSEPSSYTDENKVVKSPSSFDYRVSLFNTELSRRRIHLAELQRLTSQGIPDSGGIRAITWKVLLGYLSRNRDDWATELEKKRAAYAVFREEMIINPSEVTRRKEEMEAMKAAELEALEGPLQRHEISHDDHPLSLGSKSVWHQFFQDTELAEQINRDVKRTHPDMQFFCGDNDFARENQEALKRILFIFAKLNPGIRYVQGMNEVLAPLYYVFKTDIDEFNSKHAEEDSFFCFVELLSDFRDHFCQQLDNSAVGIRSTISQMTQLLRKHDEELWRHLEITSKVNPQFYAFRWITLLLTQEFNFADSLRLWDSLLSNPDGPLEILLRVCCSMLLCLRSRLLAGDFTTNLKLLQHYPSVDINHLLKVADDLKELK
ncbi:uncharacterized protein [Physcomitrium patens]|uniref:Rab-GAP TBC domain-containing protein n=2 Tax=Physcomitrium patens TaxID=3218 RepID=A0A2K1K6Q9_PHYPA|nr:TBC domain-containing protein C1952.17c-like [Physcomitrium patens]PNR49464.1 hypothetical protein PHYPA_011360 [Physcomitrium patens]|eukprot:XP_024382453.1 TBC domain-containing protein C1952.17c-like [Physcomitrella patens]